MKNMKKTLCLLLAVLMTVSLLAGCGKKVDDNADRRSLRSASMPSILPSAIWAMTAATPALTLRLPRRPAISWAGR